MTRPTAIAATPYADAERLLPGHQFADAYKVQAPHGVDAIAGDAHGVRARAAWIRTLMGLRNGLGRLVGLKAAPAAGFPMLRQSADEVVLGFDDKHLDFRIVVDRRPAASPRSRRSCAGTTPGAAPT